MKNHRRFTTPSRRRFLQGIATAGLSAPLWPIFDAHAQPAGARPIRFLLVWQPNGLDRNNWLKDDNSFGRILEPLAPVKNDVVILKNFNNKKSGGGADPHIGFGAGSTTGREIVSPYDGSEGTGESIDWILSKTIGKDRPRKFLGMRNGKNAVGAGHLTFSGPRSPVPYEIDVAMLFANLFGNVMPPGGMDPAARLRRKSVLDVVAGDLALVQSKLGARDRAKLDAHLSTIRDMEPLLMPAASPPPATGKCEPPNITEEAGPATGFRRFMNLTAAAFTCDHTRVATYQWGGPGAHLAWKVPGANPTSGTPGPGQVKVERVGAWTHHNLDHGKINGGAGYTGEMLGEMRVNIMTYYMTQFAWLIQKLKSIPEGQGTLLDNTVVVWMNEASSNGHNGSGAPFMIAGAANKWRSGRVVDVAGASQNDAWLTIAKLMGVDLPAFGNPEWTKGPIAPLLS